MLKEDHFIDIGAKIRNARKKANMSIKTLAKLSDMSPVSIQKVETNRMVPTITSLLKISRALGKKVSFFIEEEDRVSHVALVKKGRRKKFYSERSKCLHEYIAGELDNAVLGGGVFSAQPGGESGKKPSSHPGEEIIFCLKGEIEVQIAEDKHRLRAGDVLHFKSDVSHRWRNCGKSNSQILWIYTQISK